MEKSLLLISSLPDDATFAREVAATAGLPCEVTADPKTGAKLVAQEKVAAIIADVSDESRYKALESAIQESIGLFSDKVNANAFHFLSSSALEDVKYLIQSPLFGHFIMRNYKDPKEAGQYYGRVVKATLSDRAFGLSNLLMPNTKIQAIQLKRSTQKQDAVEAVKSYLIACKFQSRMATVIANAVDEIIMNAIYDAPVDDLGRQVLAATPRTTLIELEGQHAVEMHVGYDGNCIGVTAIDLYGSLDKTKLLSHISKIYTEEEYKVRTAVAGAGIGLATVFRSGGSFFFVSESRTRTEVTVFFRRTENFREFKDQFRFLSTQFYF